MRVVLPGIPKSQARPRFSNGRVYNPSAEECQSIREALKVACRRLKWEITAEPVAVNLEFVMPEPKSRKARDKPPKIDVDNAVKLFLDACNETVWQDDRQVVELWATKRYGPIPQTIFMVSEYGPVKLRGKAD